MKKSVVFFIGSLLAVALMTGCTKNPDTPQTDDAASNTLPQFADDVSDNPLGQWDKTSAFGILTKVTEEGLTLTMQNKAFFFTWSDTAKKHYSLLNIQEKDEVLVRFETQGDGSRIATDIERVN